MTTNSIINLEQLLSYLEKQVLNDNIYNYNIRQYLIDNNRINYNNTIINYPVFYNNIIDYQKIINIKFPKLNITHKFNSIIDMFLHMNWDNNQIFNLILLNIKYYCLEFDKLLNKEKINLHEFNNITSIQNCIYKNMVIIKVKPTKHLYTISEINNEYNNIMYIANKLLSENNYNVFKKLYINVKDNLNNILKYFDIMIDAVQCNKNKSFDDLINKHIYIHEVSMYLYSVKFHTNIIYSKISTNTKRFKPY